MRAGDKYFIIKYINWNFEGRKKLYKSIYLNSFFEELTDRHSGILVVHYNRLIYLHNKMILLSYEEIMKGCRHKTN